VRPGGERKLLWMRSQRSRACTIGGRFGEPMRSSLQRL
jgi:hypothetical protein